LKEVLLRLKYNQLYDVYITTAYEGLLVARKRAYKNG